MSLVCIPLTGAALAQDVAAGKGAPVRVQSSTQMFLPGPTDGSEEAQKLRDTAHRLFYEMAGRECQMLYDTIARECRIETVNLNLTRQANPQLSGLNVNGSVRLLIVLR